MREKVKGGGGEKKKGKKSFATSLPQAIVINTYAHPFGIGLLPKQSILP